MRILKQLLILTCLIAFASLSSIPSWYGYDANAQEEECSVSLTCGSHAISCSGSIYCGAGVRDSFINCDGLVTYCDGRQGEVY